MVKELRYFLYPLYKAQSMTESSFSSLFIAIFPFSFGSNAADFFICSLNRQI